MGDTRSFYVFQAIAGLVFLKRQFVEKGDDHDEER